MFRFFYTGPVERHLWKLFVALPDFANTVRTSTAFDNSEQAIPEVVRPGAGTQKSSAPQRSGHRRADSHPSPTKPENAYLPACVWLSETFLHVLCSI